MIFISHRGNLNGIILDRENSPEYINEAIEKGYLVVVDVWLVGEDHFALGNDRPKYLTNIEYIKQNNIICRARSLNTLNALIESRAHCFFQDYERISLTNGGLIWAAPSQSVTPRSIVIMPEHEISNVRTAALLKCAGICSNFIQLVREEREELEKVALAYEDKNKLETIEENDEVENTSSDNSPV